MRGAAYGLILECSRAVPGLAPAGEASGPVVRVEMGSVPAALRGGVAWHRETEGRAEVRVSRGQAGTFLSFEDGCEAAVDASGHQVWCAWPAHLALEDAAIYLLGPVLAAVLRMHGRTVLHAATLSDGERALALVGSAGSGKSTTAAALVERGMRLLGDDVLALERDAAGRLRALPGPPRIRLWDDAAAALFGDPAKLPLLTPNWDKRYRDAAQQRDPLPRPVTDLYLLAARTDGRGPALLPVQPREAVMALVGNTYHGWLSRPEERRRDLASCADLVRGARVRRLVPRDDRGSLGSLADLILHEFRGAHV